MLRMPTLIASSAAAVLIAATPTGAAPDSSCMSVDVTWDGATVTGVDVVVGPRDDDLAPLVVAQILGADSQTLWSAAQRGEVKASWAPGVGQASAVVVEEGARPGDMCRVWVDAPAAEEAPAYAPPPPPPGDHRPEVAEASTLEPTTSGSRVLHSR